MKKNLLLALLLFISSNSYSQNNSWSLYKQQNGVEIYLMLDKCERPENGTYKEMLYIKLVNTNNYKVNVAFDKELWYDNTCRTCGQTNENKVKVSVPANTELKGDCRNDELSALKIFSKMLKMEKVAKLTKYELKNIAIEKVD